MQSTKQLAAGVLTVVAVMAAAALLFIVPNYREARAVRAQVRDLQARVSTLADRSKAVDRLAEDVRRARDSAARNLKVIPETADVAGLIRKLSDPIDGVNVADQTFTAGTAGEAVVGGKVTAMSLPVSADMRATFESVVAMIDKAEAMARLVRVSSVRLLCKRDEQKSDVPLLSASVGLEVIYDPMDQSPEVK